MAGRSCIVCAAETRDRPGAPDPAVAGRLRWPTVRGAAVSALPSRLRSRRPRPAALPGAGVAGAARACGGARGADRRAAKDQRGRRAIRTSCRRVSWLQG